MELGEAIGLKGFGAELFTTASSGVTNQVLSNLANTALGPANIFNGFNPRAVVSEGPVNSLNWNLLGNAVGSFLGAKLGAMIVSPQTQAGVALSSMGAAVGAFALGVGASGSAVSIAVGTYISGVLGGGVVGGSTAGAWLAFNVITPGIGALVGFVLGALIGNLFGKKKPKVPTASAETVLQIPYARYELGTITAANGGNRDLVTSMATTARDTLNGLIAMIAYTNTTAYVSNLNGYGTTQAYGHTGGQIYVKINGAQTNFSSADQAVEFGALTAIRNTKIVGGDIFAKRAIVRSPAADLTSLAGDLQVASDYRFYASNRSLVNGFITGAYAALTQAEQNYYTTNKVLIDKAHAQGAAALTAGELSTYNANKPTIDKIIGALENQALANPWIITLQRVSELGLDKWTPSDFYGGLQGFLSSFDLAAHGTAFENVRIMAQGGGAEIQARLQTSDGIFSILPQAIDGASDNDVLNARFQGGLQGWDLATWNVVNPQRGVNLTDWSGSGNDTYYMYMPGTPAAGAVMDTRSDWIVTQAGVTFEASVQAAQHRGLVQLLVEFYDASYNLIQTSYMSGSARESGSYHGDLANYNTISGTATAPAGTVYRRLNLRLVATGAEVPFGFYTQPTSRAAGGAALDWTVDGEAVRIEDLSQVGYGVRALGGQTSGNDLIDQRLSAGAVTIDDQHSEEQTTYDYYWNGYEYEQYETTITVTVDGGDDIFVGSQYNDALYGRSGWDWLDGRGGDDWMEGGAGNDVLIGRNGNDVLLGGDGDDYLAAGDGADNVQGGAGADILVDGTGSECVQGDDGDDTFLIAPDYTFNWFWGGTQDFNSDPNGKDTISAERMTVGVRFDIDFRPPEWNGNPDPLAGDGRTRAAIVTDAVTGTWFASEGLIGIENATGSNFNDQIYGTVGDNVLKGLAGNDRLYGREGADVLEGGAGADVLDGGPGADFASYAGSAIGVYVDLSAGKAFNGDAEGDTLIDIGNLRGSKFADLLKGNEFAGRLEGLAGDDWLVATAGADTYDGGEGKDFVDYKDSTEGVYLILGAYTPTFVYNGTGYTGLATGHTYVGVEGAVGSAYVDFLYGSDGDQTLIGGAGNDYLAGAAGADTYVISRGDGYDTITEDNTGWNVLSFGEGIKFSDLWGGTAGGANGWLDVGVRGDNAQARITGNFANLNSSKIKTLDLNGAGQLDMDGIEYSPAGASDNNDTLVGWTNRTDLIMGYNGDDVIYGASPGQSESKGNIIIAGLGNDTIVTSGGDDQFAYDRGDGLDNINDIGGEDTLVFGPTVTAADVIYQVVGNDLYIGAKSASNPTLTASQVADRVQIVGGGIKYVVMDGYSNTLMYESLNTVEYVIVGGTSIDLRKLDIQWTEQISYNYDNYYPIALDLDGDGLNLSTVDSSSVVVKTAGGGISKIGWVGPTDGFLAVDRDGDGAINRLSEISFVQDKPGATSDLEGLRTWDTNGDGVLDKSDKDFGKILLFVDANQNGRSTAKELRTLEQAGIKAINLGGQATGYTRDMTIDSFVQNTLSFVWADGSTGEGYDVALARRVLGSDGLYAGEYQAEWGARDEDGTLGRLSNDPKAAAKAARIRARKGLLDKLGASYGEVKAAAQLDFSDTDKVDASVAQRWKKMDASQLAAWLSGQSSGLDGQQNLTRLKVISSGQALRNALNDGAQAGQDLIIQGFDQAQALVSTAARGADAASAQAGAAGLGVGFGEASGLGGVAASEPLEGVVVAGGRVGETSSWWRGETGGGLSGAGSLANLLAAMDQGVAKGGTGSEPVSDPALLQQQMLLRQAMAGFGAPAGGSAAVWDRDGAAPQSILAASGRTMTPSTFSPALAS